MPQKVGNRAIWASYRFWAPVLVAFAVVFLLVPKPPLHNVTGLVSKVTQNDYANPSLQKQVLQVISGHDVLWQMPEARPKGLLFLAHGCSVNLVAVVLQTPSYRLLASITRMPRLSRAWGAGLPEEVAIRQEALRLGYAAVAVSSIDRQGARCWDVQPRAEQSVDGRDVAAILRTVQSKEGLAGLPLYTLGASSGGAFVLMLPHLVEVKGVIAQIMGVPPRLLRLPGGRTYPPTVFVHMPRDSHTASMVQADIAALQIAGVPAAEIKIDPRPLTAAFLSSRSPHISNSTAAGIVSALQEGGLLSRDTGSGGGMLLKDPRVVTPQWQELLKAGVPGLAGVSLVPDESPVSELLNLAWAGHEIVSDHVAEALVWLAVGGKVTLEAGNGT